jgi:hypothetical protein
LIFFLSFLNHRCTSFLSGKRRAKLSNVSLTNSIGSKGLQMC